MAGQLLLALHTDDPDTVPAARDALRDAITIGDRAVDRSQLLLDVVG